MSEVRRPLAERRVTLIIDADDTLWENNVHFEEATERFLDLAEQKARAHALRKMSLIVFEQNGGAMRLYERSGYEEVRREPVVPHPLIHYTGDAVLMVKDID